MRIRSLTLSTDPVGLGVRPCQPPVGGSEPSSLQRGGRVQWRGIDLTGHKCLDSCSGPGLVLDTGCSRGQDRHTSLPEGEETSKCTFSVCVCGGQGDEKAGCGLGSGLLGLCVKGSLPSCLPSLGINPPWEGSPSRVCKAPKMTKHPKYRKRNTGLIPEGRGGRGWGEAARQ